MKIKCIHCEEIWDDEEDIGLPDGQCPWCGLDKDDGNKSEKIKLVGGKNGRKKILDLDL